MLNTKNLKKMMNTAPYNKMLYYNNIKNNIKNNNEEETENLVYSGGNDIFIKNNDDNNKNSIVLLNDNINENKNIMDNIEKFDSIEIVNKDNIIFDENKNAFIINENNIIYTILVSDILNYIINSSTNEHSIKKYIFVISFNNIKNMDECNFINNTIFTNNLNMMIKLQNILYENINRDDFVKNNIQYKNKFIMFYNQIVIFMFKTTYDENIYDKYKIINTYSTLSFRISSIIFKQITLLQHKYENISSELENINNIKNNLNLKINDLGKKINVIEEDNSDNTNSISSKTQDKKEEISIESSITENLKNDKNYKNLIDSPTSSSIIKEKINKNDKNNIILSGGSMKNNMLSPSFNSDDELEELDYTNEPTNNYINDLSNISSMSNSTNSTKNNSYNSKSAINNGRMYFIK